MKTREASLCHFFLQAFSVAQLRRFLAGDDATASLLNEIPNAPVAEMSHSVVAELSRARLIDDSLFDRLLSARPRWQVAIERLRVAWREDGDVDPDMITSTLDPKTSALIRKVESSFRKALELESSIFEEIVMDDLHRLVELASERAAWTFDSTSVAQYTKILLNIYRSAERAVFSTSIPDYEDTWSSTLGRHIVDAHKAGTAKVTRVFVYQTRSDLTAERFEMIRNHQRELPNATIKIYIDDEDPSFHFDANISRDFTIVDDGEMVGLTQAYGRRNLSAKWRFRDESLAHRLEKHARYLLDGAKFLHEIEM